MNAELGGDRTRERESIGQTGLVYGAARQLDDLFRFTVREPELRIAPVEIGCADAVFAPGFDEACRPQTVFGNGSLALAANRIDKYCGEPLRNGVVIDVVPGAVVLEPVLADA